MSVISIKNFFDPETFTLTYVVSDDKTGDAVIIDPVLDFDPPSGAVEDRSIKNVIDFVREQKFNILGILETHAHADHLSSSQILKQHFPKAKLGIGEKIKIVQEVFKQHFNIEYLLTDASQFDVLFKDFEEYTFGSLKMKAIPTPGHTPACMSYLFRDNLFSGDALFMPDSGTGRCDFPKGSAKDLYFSVSKNLYSLPDETKVYVGHDYAPNGREIKFQTTIGESKKNNIQLKLDTTESEYIQFREARDKTLKAPRLLLPSIQVNIDGGKLPPREDNGKSYLKLPLNPKLNLGKL
jgi:glyoxylase-like metal-dependent hydrolase (beta-lactamase superfamily II)